MKTMIASLKRMIESEKVNHEKHESDEKRLFDLSMGCLREGNKDQGEILFQESRKEYDKKMKSYWKLRNLRSALICLREADGQEQDKDFSIWEPEVDLKK